MRCLVCYLVGVSLYYANGAVKIRLESNHVKRGMQWLPNEKEVLIVLYKAGKENFQVKKFHGEKLSFFCAIVKMIVEKDFA